tara:strand:+ start:247 stop:348 length:102 start_codon:yes stop_codon:yes gene_type:complete
MAKIKNSVWLGWLTVIAFANEIFRMIIGRNNNE